MSRGSAADAPAKRCKLLTTAQSASGCRRRLQGWAGALSNALAQTPSHRLCSPALRATLTTVNDFSGAGPQRVLASELAGRPQPSDALSMMVGDMVRMVQAGRSTTSRWNAS